MHHPHQCMEKKDGDLNELKNMGLLKPLNMYAKSKLLFDEFLIENFDINSEIIGLRYFNVYGNNEDHKLNMASPIHNFFHQIKRKNFAKYLISLMVIQPEVINVILFQ